MSLNNIKDYFFVIKKTYSIGLDYCPNTSKWILIEVEKYCSKEKLSYELVEENPDILVKINNVICKCTVSTGGRYSNYIITCREI